jgi:hypothetical protein
MTTAGSSSSVGGCELATSDEKTVLPLLTEVGCDEDKFLIVDVINAIRMCRDPDVLCTTWTCVPSATGYTVIAYLPRPGPQHQEPVEVTHDDIAMIECVNVLRVRVGVACLPQGTWALKVHITGHSSAVSFTAYDSVRIRARRSIWSADSGILHRIASAMGWGAAGGNGGSRKRARMGGGGVAGVEGGGGGGI